MPREPVEQSQTASPVPLIVTPSVSASASATPLVVTATVPTSTMPLLVMTIVASDAVRATVPFVAPGTPTSFGQTPSQAPPRATSQTPSIVSLTALNLTTPQDILDEIMYFVGGADGSLDCSGTNFQSPTLFFQGTVFAQRGDVITTLICGLASESEPVDVQEEMPDHPTRYYQVFPTSSYIPYAYDYPNPEVKYQVELIFLIDVYDPIGTYHRVFTGDSWFLKQDIVVTVSTSPRLFLRDQKLIFVGFQPNENIRLFVYNTSTYDPSTKTIKLLGWQEFQTDSNGGLIVTNVDYAEGAYAAIGDLSGEAFFDGWRGSFESIKHYGTE
jgi:hypothetical protein